MGSGVLTEEEGGVEAGRRMVRRPSATLNELLDVSSLLLGTGRDTEGTRYSLCPLGVYTAGKTKHTH